MSVSRAVELWVPSSKSITHRAFLLGALSEVPCLIERPLWGADCRSTLSVLQALGARAHRVGDHVQFHPIEALVPVAGTLDCGNSGTTLRLLSGQAARLSQAVELSGDASLCARPNGPLLGALEALGAHVTSCDGRAPLSLCGPLRAGTVALPARVSSQYGSSLLLALCLVEGTSQLRMAAPVASRPYLHITRRVAAAFGLSWTVTETEVGLQYDIVGGQRPTAAAYRVPGDWSGAAFPLVAGALAGAPMRLLGLEADDPQGDRAIVSILERFGQILRWEGTVLCLEPQPLRAAGTIDLGATPDLFPVLVALAAMCPGQTAFVGAPSLRHKECDRIRAMAAVLAALGLRSVEAPDGLTVWGGAPRPGGSVSSEHDHRIYMAARVLSLRAPWLQVDGAGCERVSYPRFEAHLAQIQAAVSAVARGSDRREGDA
ncbi:MAG TPA: 3-phosphoshikimate 1-carboxyvinyltransferase [Deltaproteobacteria bacterium]|nr:3-phosphoshikimate 1-carboxyvinyltransferase [Deltaproteobacteria bacterium]